MYYAKITDNDGRTNEIFGVTIADLQCALRGFINDNGFGASDIGATYNVTKNDEKVGTLYYNGVYKNV